MESGSVEVNGIHLRWEQEGEGQPVVLVHGIPTSPRLWRHVIPRVSGARSMAWEVVGYGASIEEGEGRDISVAKQAEYLAAWLQAVGLDEGAVVVGHDLGGGVAQILAVLHPELVKGLVLTNAICYDSWPIPIVKAMRDLGGAIERLPDALLRYNLYVGLFLRGHDDLARAKESFGEHWPHYQRVGAGAALMRQVRSLDVRDTLSIADRIPILNVPARLVWGAATGFRRSATDTGSLTSLVLPWNA